jgi:hypothetical protein
MNLVIVHAEHMVSTPASPAMRYWPAGQVVAIFIFVKQDPGELSEHFCLMVNPASKPISLAYCILSTKAEAESEALLAISHKEELTELTPSALSNEPLAPEVLPGHEPLQSPHSSTSGPLLG